MNYNDIVFCNLCGKKVRFGNANEGVRNTILCNKCFNKIYGEKNLRIVELKTKIAEADRKLEKFKNTKITDIKVSAYPSDCPYKRGDNDA